MFIELKAADQSRPMATHMQVQVLILFISLIIYFSLSCDDFGLAQAFNGASFTLSVDE